MKTRERTRTIRHRRTSEKQIAAAIVAILKRRPDHRATVAELIHVLPIRIKFTRADRAPSPTRPGEPMWHQRVRNVRSHNTGNRYGLRNVPGGFALVAKPRKDVIDHVAAIVREGGHHVYS